MSDPEAKTPVGRKTAASVISTVSVGCYVVGMIFVLSWINPTAEVAAARKVANEQNRQLCAASNFCNRYGEMRQACATAGDFDNCLRVKVGDKDTWRVHYCTADGGVTNLPPNASMPNFLQCLYYNMGG
jgi:hypothetical protein